MRYMVYITRVADGKMREHREEGDWTDAGMAYQWFEGNYSCDCNRALFFARAGGEDDPEIGCGEGAYSVRLVNADTGATIEP